MTGNAGTATKLQTARTINGVSFDGSTNISVNAANDASLVHTIGNETIAGSKTFSDRVYTNGGLFSKGVEVTGAIPYIDFHYANDTGNYTSRIIENNKGQLSFLTPSYAKMKISADLEGAADVATKLQTPRTIAITGDMTGSGTFDGSGDLSISAMGTSTTTNLYGKGTYFTTDSYLVMIVSGKVVSVQGTLMTKVAMSGGAYLGEAIVPAQYAPPVARKNTVGFNAGSPGSKVYADVTWSIDGMLSIDNIVNGSNMTAWGTIPAGSQLSFADTWVIA